MNENELSLSQHEQALSLHQRIMTSGSLAAQNLFDMATALKEMRDGKLYKELGYSNFEGYCEEEVGMKRRYAYKFISVVENINLENVPPVAHFGIKKLELLAKLSDEEQKQVVENIDEKTTYKELQEEINKLKDRNKDLGAAKDRAVAAQTSLEEEINRLKGEKMLVENAKAKLESEIADAADENARLDRENKELRERPVEVAVVDNSDSERRIQETIRSLERENIKRNEEMDKRYIEERRDLEERKNKEVAAIRAEYEEKLRAAQDQSGEPDKEKQEFKILLVMAHDAVNRLVSFANSHKKRIYTEKAGDLLAASAAALKE